MISQVHSRFHPRTLFFGVSLLTDYRSSYIKVRTFLLQYMLLMNTYLKCRCYNIFLRKYNQNGSMFSSVSCLEYVKLVETKKKRLNLLRF